MTAIAPSPLGGVVRIGRGQRPDYANMRTMPTGLDQPSLKSPLAMTPKREFRDAFERRAYCRSWILGRRLLESPALIERGRAFLDRFVKGDPRQCRVYELWTSALGLPVDELVAQLLADDERGAALRETAPVFVVIPADEVRALERVGITNDAA